MKKTVLIYAGTTEGRQLAERLAGAGISCDVRVATEYGSLVMPELAHVTVTVGRLNTEQMRALAQQGYAAIVDATHPFATEVSQNIRESVAGLEVPCFRLSRERDARQTAAAVRSYTDIASCAQALAATEGNILLTTGSKELAAFCRQEALRERLFVRVLPSEESLAACHAQGIYGRQIVAMQGPFSKEMNLALIHELKIRHLVTKESGKNGGVLQKLEAAEEAGITAHVIRNPETGKADPFRGILVALERLLGIPIPAKPHISISLIGIGMSKETLTREAARALDEADLLFGAERMLQVAERSRETKPPITVEPAPERRFGGRESYACYRLGEILPVLQKKEQEWDKAELRVAILFSGDTGFYSGAQKIKEGLNKNGFHEIHIFPGISSVSCLAAAVGETWQDAALLSIHGKSDTGAKIAAWQTQLLHAVSTHAKTFLLVSGSEDIAAVGAVLEGAGLGKVELACGYRMGYPDEEILRLCAREAAEGAITKPGLYTCLLQNPSAAPARVTPGLPDEAFRRGKVPMTKEEIRAVSICKLGLVEDAVVYDVGSGTGSIAVECALRAPGIRVYAIEQKAEAQQLLRQNVQQFHLHNVVPVDGSAPEALQDLEPSTHVFIGGSSGKLSEILAAVWKKNPLTRVVVNAVSLETIAQMKEVQTDFAASEGYRLSVNCVQLQVSRAREAGSYHLMQAENPVYIYTLERILKP